MILMTLPVVSGKLQRWLQVREVDVVGWYDSKCTALFILNSMHAIIMSEPFGEPCQSVTYGSFSPTPTPS